MSGLNFKAMARFNKGKTRYYKSLDEAAEAAARVIHYNSGIGSWKFEYCMGIHGNATNYDDGNSYFLTELHGGTNGTRAVLPSYDVGLKEVGYSLKAMVHSHPTDTTNTTPPLANELSVADFCEALNIEGRFGGAIVFYLITQNWAFTRFTPPLNSNALSSAHLQINSAARHNFRRVNNRSFINSKDDIILARERLPFAGNYAIYATLINDIVNNGGEHKQKNLNNNSSWKPIYLSGSN